MATPRLGPIEHRLAAILAAGVGRREFIALVCGVAGGWPLAAHAQQRERVRRIGVLLGVAENDPQLRTRIKAFQQALQELGWVEGRNIRIDYRWTSNDADLARRYGSELIALAPEVVFAAPHSSVAALHQQTHKIPIVFVQSGDPVQAGFAQSLARPGGNITGFVGFEATISAKYLQLLKDVAPHLARVAVVQAGRGHWEACAICCRHGRAAVWNTGRDRDGFGG